MTPAATPATGSATPAVSLGSRTPQTVNPLTLEEALRLATAQASSFQQAGLNEQIATEDVKQAQAAFLPKVSAPLSYIYTSPAIGLKPGEPQVLFDGTPGELERCEEPRVRQFVEGEARERLNELARNTV